MRMKSRRTLAVLLSMILLLALAPSGFAVNLEAPNTLTVNFVPENSDFGNDLKTARIQVDLYQLAAAVPDVISDSYHYDVPETDNGHPFWAALTQLQGDLADAEKLEDQNNRDTVFDKFEPYAQTFAGIVLDSHPEIPVTRSELAVAENTTITVDNLDAGLYLLIIRGAGLTTKDGVPETGYVVKTEQASGETGTDKTVTYATRVVTDDYEYLYRPQLLTVPTKVSEENVQQYNTAYGNWVNSLTIYAKPTREANNGDLKIIKNVNNPGPDPVDFVFEVSWLGKDRIPVTKVVSMTFEGETRKEYVLANTVPIGTEVTVTEVHSGIGYTAEISSRTATIVATPTPTEGAASADSADSAGIAEVVFTNDHTGPGGGHGILNRFTAGSGSSSFTGVQYDDSNEADRASRRAG
ncbi:MAG: hypothetical protein IIW12_04715 [Oscillospiraceae bacterium]|nr:hypothetical protein [Oscillospiraceae bacterium]